MAQHNAAKNFIFAFFLLLYRVRVLVVRLGDALPFAVDLQQQKNVREVDLAASALFEDAHDGERFFEFQHSMRVLKFSPAPTVSTLRAGQSCPCGTARIILYYLPQAQECTFLYHTNKKETKVGEMTKSEAKKLHCTVEAAIAVIGGKYKAIIIWWLNEKGVMRYSEIQRRVPQATAKMLSQQLREMEADGIISRKVYPVVPPKTEYALTDLGKATVPIVHAMDKWGADFFTRLGVPIPCDET